MYLGWVIASNTGKPEIGEEVFIRVKLQSRIVSYESLTNCERMNSHDPILPIPASKLFTYVL